MVRTFLSFSADPVVEVVLGFLCSSIDGANACFLSESSGCGGTSGGPCNNGRAKTTLINLSDASIIRYRQIAHRSYHT